MEIKKVNWRKRDFTFVDAAKGWIPKPIVIGTHGYGECTDDNITYYFTINSKGEKDGKEVFIAIIDTFTPPHTEATKIKLAIGNSIYIAEDEIKGTTPMKTS